MAHMTRSTMRGSWLIIGVLATASCGGVTDSEQLPANVYSPDEMQEPKAALAAYNRIHAAFRAVFDDIVLQTGLLTDELGSSDYGLLVFGQPSTLNRRSLPDEGSIFGGPSRVELFAALNGVRAQAGQAIGLLTKYAPDLSPALRAYAYAASGYAEVLLAEIYCSGIPLSTVDFEDHFTLRSGSTTQEVYRHAVALFDTAIALASDSAKFLHLAQVGKGRALLGLGRYLEAGNVVAEVPDNFNYSFAYQASTGLAGGENTSVLRSSHWLLAVSTDGEGYTVSDQEGFNGMPYRSSGDPRSAVVFKWDNIYGFSLWVPVKYPQNGSGSIVVASGTEARLIEAEAALQAGSGDFIARLNALRSSMAELDPLESPEGFDARVDLLFQERAFWLFLTGSRQGDLRRLVREYGRPDGSVYPSGVYPDGQGVYGNDVTLPVPHLERERNPLYNGCISRRA